MQPKYSVIVPVYNAERTLRRCVDSLLAERYPDMELILVNDGSKDASLKICRDYADRFENVRVIDKENGGVSTARNAGLDAAGGSFVLFVDSDDFVMPGFFLTIDQIQSSSNADFIQFSYCFDDSSQIRESRLGPLIVSTRKEIIPLIVNAICRKTLNSPWAKLYKRDLLEAHHIRFPVGASVAEDRVFNIHYSFYIQSYVVSEEVLYVVDTGNENSLTRGRHADLQRQFDITDEYFYQALNDALTAYKAAKQESRKQARLASLKEELDGYVAAGSLTQEQADLLLSYYAEQLAQNASGMGGGRGGKGMRNGQKGTRNGQNIQNGQNISQNGFGRGGKHGRMNQQAPAAPQNGNSTTTPEGTGI